MTKSAPAALQRGFGIGEPACALVRRERRKASRSRPTPLPEADRPTVQQPASAAFLDADRRVVDLDAGAAGQASSSISAFQVISGAGRPLGVSPAQTTISGA